MNTLTTTPTIPRQLPVITPSMTDQGLRRLLLSMSNGDRVQKMSRRQLAQCLGRMAESEHPWTMRFEVLTAAAKALAPELFD